jgi:hypothetical protein
MQVSLEELQLMLGRKDIEIFILEKQVFMLQKHVAQLEKKNETPDPAAGTASS